MRKKTIKRAKKGTYISAKVDPGFLQALEVYRKKQGLSKSAVIVQAIQEHIGHRKIKDGISRRRRG